ncbi:hypothetical protein GE09DRAFT_459627 [Coniochaeta sp. 2T2.1]|nr:hypothetical protein GE09DRAFT_459627 [Coniochaeta sp. 2T2.1]
MPGRIKRSRLVERQLRPKQDKGIPFSLDGESPGNEDPDVTMTSPPDEPSDDEHVKDIMREFLDLSDDESDPDTDMASADQQPSHEHVEHVQDDQGCLDPREIKADPDVDEGYLDPREIKADPDADMPSPPRTWTPPPEPQSYPPQTTTRPPREDPSHYRRLSVPSLPKDSSPTRAVTPPSKVQTQPPPPPRPGSSTPVVGPAIVTSPPADQASPPQPANVGYKTPARRPSGTDRIQARVVYSHIPPPRKDLPGPDFARFGTKGQKRKPREDDNKHADAAGKQQVERLVVPGQSDGTRKRKSDDDDELADAAGRSPSKKQHVEQEAQPVETEQTEQTEHGPVKYVGVKPLPRDAFVTAWAAWLASKSVSTDSDIESTESEQVTQAKQIEQIEQVEKVEKVEHVEHIENVEQVEHVEHVEHATGPSGLMVEHVEDTNAEDQSPSYSPPHSSDSDLDPGEIRGVNTGKGRRAQAGGGMSPGGTVWTKEVHGINIDPAAEDYDPVFFD